MSDIITREEFSRLQSVVTSIDSKLGRFEVLEERDKFYKTKFDSLTSELQSLNTILLSLPDRITKAIENMNVQRRQDIEDIRSEYRSELAKELRLLNKDLHEISEVSKKMERYQAMILGAAAIVSVISMLAGSYIYDKVLTLDEIVVEYRSNKNAYKDKLNSIEKVDKND